MKKVIMIHIEKDGIQNFSISHTNAKTSFLKKSWSELGFPKKHVKMKGPKSKTFVRKTSTVSEADGGCRGGNTQASYCYQINIQDFSTEVKNKILEFFEKEEIVPEETETQATQSQDFREFHGSQRDGDNEGRDKPKLRDEGKLGRLGGRIGPPSRPLLHEDKLPGLVAGGQVVCRLRQEYKLALRYEVKLPGLVDGGPGSLSTPSGV